MKIKNSLQPVSQGTVVNNLAAVFKNALQWSVSINGDVA